MSGLRILRAGPACTVQDAGRQGYLRFGVTPAGPMDWIAHQIANLLAGNEPGVAALEIGPGGLSLTVEGESLRLGIAARGFRIRRDGSDLPARVSLVLRPGSRLDIEPGRTHSWAYLAVGGGFAAPPVLGSLSTHVRSGLGPFGGRPLTAGQTLDVLSSSPADAEEWAVYDDEAPPDGPIRYVPGPQDDYFSAETTQLFAAAEYRLANRSDRMAYRLAGPPLAHEKGHDIVSDGIAMGAIQVPGDGLPLVLMSDRQPTGGYPKIGTVIRADLPRLAQARPGSLLRFMPVSIGEAVDALRKAVPDSIALGARARRIRYFRG